VLVGCCIASQGGNHLLHLAVVQAGRSPRDYRGDIIDGDRRLAVHSVRGNARRHRPQPMAHRSRGQPPAVLIQTRLPGKLRCKPRSLRRPTCAIVRPAILTTQSRNQRKEFPCQVMRTWNGIALADARDHLAQVSL
jgi:hypothetical protein